MRLVIVGIGGFGRDVFHALRALSTEERGTIVFADDRSSEPVFGRPVIGLDSLEPDDRVMLAIADPATREAVADRLAGATYYNVAAPTSVTGPEVEIGTGAILMDQAMITASVKIGIQFHCNIYSYVEHDCVIGDYVTFAPRVSCNGNVHIGHGCYIGAGAVIRQGTPGKPLHIGERAVVGMGAVVTKSVPPGVTVVGNPARLLSR